MVTVTGMGYSATMIFAVSEDFSGQHSLETFLINVVSLLILPS